MEFLLLVGGAVGIALTFVAYAAAASNATRSSQQERGLLGFNKGAGGTRDRIHRILTEASGGHPVRVDTFTNLMAGDLIESGLRLVVAGLCAELDLTRDEHLAGHAGLGDADLDPLIRLGGPRGIRFALLDVECRAALHGLLRGSVRLSDFRLEAGELAVSIPTTGFAHEHPGLDGAARMLGALARHLEQPRDVVACLAENVARDPLSKVRLESLGVLIDEFGKEPRTRAAVEAALQDWSAEVRLRAAIASATGGLAVLTTLALDLAAADDVSADAIAAVQKHLPLDRIEPLIERAHAGPGATGARPKTTAALIQALRLRPDRRALVALETLARTGHAAYGPDAIAAMIAIERVGVEQSLLAALDPGPDRKRTIEEAAKALGQVGTAEAVLPLKEAAARSGGRIASAARQAIASIQSRIEGTPGRLALAGDDDGQLSLSRDEGGHISLPDDGDAKKP